MPAFQDTVAAYRTAIADYLAAMDTTASPLPDTVFVGRHPDFPDIELPDPIAGRRILLIDPTAAEAVKDRTHFAYLNVFATFTPGRVEFFVVRFGEGFRHRPDGAQDRHLHYRVDGQHGLVLEQMVR